MGALGDSREEQMTDAAGRMTDEAVDAAEDYIARGKERAASALDTARQYGSALEDEISEYPLTAVVIALGIGCVAGFLLRGR
jgi:ElaB/YqjD/DUF883 family membrane-anchored ribosome-binding protein